MSLSAQRARLTTQDLERWQHAIGELLANDPELAEALADPRRNHNQVCSSVEWSRVYFQFP